MFVIPVLVCLVEYTQHHVQSVIYLSVQSGNLYDDAIVGQTLHEWVWQSFRHHFLIVVAGHVVDIQHRLLDIAYFVTKQIDSHHR